MAAKGQFKSFVSEEELQESRRLRQEEWEKVRQPDQPLEAPEEEYNPRSLFDRLQQQKAESQDKYEEKFKLSNQVKGLEEDEAEFLNSVSEKQLEIEREREQEDMKLISEVKAASSILLHSKTETENKPLKQQLVTNKKDKSQKSILAGAVKRKSCDNESGDISSPAKKPCNSSSKETSESSYSGGTIQVAHPVGVLPGLINYSGSSDDSSNTSSDSDIELPTKRVVHVNVQLKS